MLNKNSKHDQEEEVGDSDCFSLKLTQISSCGTCGDNDDEIDEKYLQDASSPMKKPKLGRYSEVYEELT